MSWVILAVLGVSVVAIAAILPLLIARRLTIIALLLSLVLLPYPVIAPVSEPEHFGITHGSLVPYTFSLALAAALLVFLRDRGARPWFLLSAGVLAYLLLLLVFVWGDTAAQQAGVAHLTTGMVAFAAGVAVGSFLLRDPLSARIWVWTLLFCFSAQLLLMIAQLCGLPLGLYGTTAYFVNEGRPIGSFIHPSVPGKIALLSLPSLLVLTRIHYRRIAVLAWSTVGLVVVITVLTQARSNALAVVGAVAIWFMLDFRLSARRRWLFVAAVGIVSIPVGLVLLPRILMDPEGGDRAALLATALQEIPHHLAYGLGANSYSSVVGQYDSLAAAGLPVHNTLLHSVAEVGIAGTVLLSIPLVMTFIRAWKVFRGQWPHADAARALATILPGLAVIYMVGWGLLLQGVFVFWMLALGIAYGMMSVDRTIMASEFKPQALISAESTRAFHAATTPRPRRS